MFTLIIYMFLQGPYYNNSSSIETIIIPGFATEQDCRYAGAQSETTSRMLVSHKNNIALTHEFICIKKSKD